MGTGISGGKFPRHVLPILKYSWKRGERLQGLLCETEQMKLTRLLCLLLALAFWDSQASAQDEYELSYLLIRQSDHRVLEAQEPDKLRIPASTLKIVTAAAALENLGADHTFATSCGISGNVRRGRLKGDLILRGEADPELSQNDLRDLARQIWATGLRRVEGDLVVDEGPYAGSPYGVGWAWDDAGEEYSPEISSLAVDHGLITLEAKSSPAWLDFEPSEVASIRIVPGWEGAQVRGMLPLQLAAPRSALRTGEQFRQHLRFFGIRVLGEVRLQGREQKALDTTVAVHRSRPLIELLREALKISDNLAMELLSRSVGSVVPSVLRDEQLRIVDGSGLSRYNLISTRQLTSVLLKNEELQEILPAPGQGTLAKRFLWDKETTIRAKTGSMSNVSALTGYLFCGTPKECVFAIMINGHLGSTADRKDIEDRLMRSWVKRYETGEPYKEGSEESVLLGPSMQR